MWSPGRPRSAESAMCRWLAYSGSPIRLEELLVKRDRSLIDQSLHSRERRDADERRRLRRRLVRRHRHAEAVPQRRTGLERPEPARARRRDLVAALPRAHPGIDRDGDPGDERASVPVRAVAVDAQRPDPRVPDVSGASCVLAVDDSLFASIEGTTDSETMFYLALTFGLERRPGRRGRADGRLRRGDRSRPRRRAARSR